MHAHTCTHTCTAHIHICTHTHLHKAHVYTHIHTQHIYIQHILMHSQDLHTQQTHARTQTHTRMHSTYTRVIVSRNILSWKGAIRTPKSYRRLLRDPRCHFSSPGCSVAIKVVSPTAISWVRALALGHPGLASPCAHNTLPATSFCVPDH